MTAREAFGYLRASGLPVGDSSQVQDDEARLRIAAHALLVVAVYDNANTADDAAWWQAVEARWPGAITWLGGTVVAGSFELARLANGAPR